MALTLWFSVCIFACLIDFVMAQILITNCVELQNMRSNLTESYGLASHINCSGSELWNGGLGFEPIGDNQAPFTGSLDGQGYTVYNLSINRPHESEVALFGYLSVTAYLHSICLDLVNVRGDEKVGSLAGHNEGFIANSNITGRIMGGYQVGGAVGINLGVVMEVGVQIEVAGTVPGWRVGGLVGQNQGTLTHCTAVGEVIGAIYVGGAAGINFEILVAIYTQGNTSGTDPGEQIGGIAGSNPGDLIDCIAFGKITGNYVVGGAIGSNFGTVAKTHTQVDVIGTGFSLALGGLAGENLGSLTDSSAIGNVTGHDIVGGAVGVNLGALSTIHTQVDVIATNLGQQVGGLVGNNQGTLTHSTATGEIKGITNIGGAVGVNSGVLAIISFHGNVYGTDQGSNIGGLVGNNINSGDITFSITIANIRGNTFLGGFVGLNAGTLFGNHAHGNITCADTGENIGGFSGVNRGTITNCTATNTLFSISPNTGGFVGENAYTGRLHNTSASGEVSSLADNTGGLVGHNLGRVSDSLATGHVFGQNHVGGLIGNNALSGRVNTSFASGDVSAEGRHVGGLIGNHEGSLENSYALGIVSGAEVVGALVGYNDGSMKHSYAIGCVTAEDHTGGFTGSGLDEEDVVQCFWNRDTTGQRYPAGQKYDRALRAFGKSTDDMMRSGTFTGWDFDAIWAIAPKASFPYLQALAPAVLPTAPDIDCPMAPLPYSHWMDEVVFLLGAWAAALILWLLWQRWEFNQRLHQAFEAKNLWLPQMMSKGDTHLVKHIIKQNPSSLQDADIQGCLPLVRAAQTGQTALFHSTITAQQIALGDDIYQAVLDTAQYYHYLPLIALLKAQRPGTSSTSGIAIKPARVSHRSGRPALASDDSTPLLISNSAPPLHEAATRGDYFAAFRLLMFEDAQPNIAHGPQAQTPLIAAAANGHFNIARLLIDYGAYPFVRDEKDRTAIHLAITQGQRIAARRLIKASMYATYWPLSFEIYLATLRENTESLTEIDLSGHGLGDADFKRLIDALANNTQITKVNLACNNITSLGLRYWVKKLATHRTVVELDISYNLLSEDGIAAAKTTLTSEPPIDIKLTGNSLLAPEQCNGMSFTATDTPTILARWSRNWQQRFSLEKMISAQRFHLSAWLGFLLMMANRIITGYLIQDLDKHNHTHSLWSAITFLVISFCIGLLSLRYVYGTWLPRQTSNGISMLFLLPVISPETATLVWQVNYPDVTLMLMRSAQLILGECPQFIIALLFGIQESFNAIVILKLIFTTFMCLLHINDWLLKGTTLLPQLRPFKEPSGRHSTTVVAML